MSYVLTLLRTYILIATGTDPQLTHYSAQLLAAIKTKSKVQFHYKDRGGRSTLDVLCTGPEIYPAVEFTRIRDHFPDETELRAICEYFLLLQPDKSSRRLFRR